MARRRVVALVLVSALVGGCQSAVWDGDLVLATADDVAAASGVETVTGDLIVDDSALETLAGLETITSVEGALVIGGDIGNTLLTSVEGLQGLADVGRHLLVKRNPALLGLEGLRGLGSVGESAAITENSRLATPGDMGALTRIGDFFLISENPTLANLDGLGALLDVEFTLAIESNATLVSIEGLTVLRSAGRLFVRRNSALPTCQAYALRDRLLAVDGLSRYDGLVDIVGNLDGGACAPAAAPSGT